MHENYVLIFRFIYDCLFIIKQIQLAIDGICKMTIYGETCKSTIGQLLYKPKKSCCFNILSSWEIVIALHNLYQIITKTYYGLYTYSGEIGYKTYIEFSLHVYFFQQYI